MTDKQQLVQEYLKSQSKAASALSGLGHNMTEAMIWKILQAHFDTGIFSSDIFFKRLTADDVVEVVTNYLDTNGQILGEITSKIDAEVSIDDDTLQKAIIKFRGHIWTIHKSDKDRFPSNPHAHDYENNLKLHLGNGNIFLRKRIVGTMGRDDLTKFRKEVENKIKGISLPAIAPI